MDPVSVSIKYKLKVPPQYKLLILNLPGSNKVAVAMIGTMGCDSDLVFQRNYCYEERRGPLSN